MQTIPKICMNCQEQFDAPLKEHNRGNAKFCCRACASSYNHKSKEIKENNCKCSTCNKEFYRSSSKMKLAKHGYHFCSRQCKQLAQSLSYEDNIPEIMPNHYNNGEYSNRNYRIKALKHKELKCEDCGFNSVTEVLVVHHVDRNRKNSDLSNLKILCPTCHEIDHFMNNDGRFTSKNGGR